MNFRLLMTLGGTDQVGQKRNALEVVAKPMHSIFTYNLYDSSCIFNNANEN